MESPSWELLCQSTTAEADLARHAVSQSSSAEKWVLRIYSTMWRSRESWGTVPGWTARRSTSYHRSGTPPWWFIPCKWYLHPQGRGWFGQQYPSWTVCPVSGCCIYGVLDKYGQFSGDDIAWVYPDYKTVLLGERKLCSSFLLFWDRVSVLRKRNSRENI